MRLGIFAKTFVRPNLAEVLDAVAAAGLQTVQFNLALVGGPSLPHEISPSLAASIREEVARRGLELAAVSGTYNMAHPDAAVRAAGLRRIGALIAAAPAMGTRIVTLCTGSRDPRDMWRRHRDNATPEAWQDMVAGVQAALEVAERHGVTLAFEPEHHNVVCDARSGRRLLDDMRSPSLRVVIDPVNLFAEGDLDRQRDTLDEAFELLGGDLVLAHAKDVRRDGTIVAAGRGALDYDRYLALLQHVPGDVPLVMHGLGEEEVPGSTAFLRAALARTSSG